MLETSIRCVLFDLDGTLVDTAPDFIDALTQLTAEQGKLPPLAEEVYQTVSDGARALTSLALGIDPTNETFAAHNQRLLDLYHEQLSNPRSALYPGMEELLRQLEEQDIAWGIVTNKPELYTQRLLAALELTPRCKAVICPDHVSVTKPHPEGILLACDRLGAELDRTVYIGDHPRDVQAAKNADVIAIAAAYGYLGADARIEEWYADFIVREPGQIIPLLNTLRFA